MSTKTAQEYMKNMKKGLVGSLNTCLPGVIDSYDPVQNVADVVLHPDGDLIVEVPVAIMQTNDFYIRVPFRPGDPVLVVFSQRDIDAFMHEEDATPTDRMLAIDDAFVIAGINLFTDPLPDEDNDKLVIGQKDGEAKMTMGDGEINFEGIVKVNGSRI